MKKIYTKPKMNLFLLNIQKNILEGGSTSGTITIRDGGDLGETRGTDDFLNY